MTQQVRTATAADQQAVMDALTLAFAADPVFRYWWPAASDYMQWGPRFALAMGERAFDSGAATMTLEGSAAALWLPPGVEPDPARLQALEMPGTEEQDAIATELRAEMDRFHPRAPHWYLWMIGVDPGVQGRGHGSALLAHTLALCDARGETAYLESSSTRNVPLYERFGFEAIGVIEVRDVPPIVPMIRPAR
ncbi:MAG: GNAT family N-acetyltransferase [Caulobacter sp.]|nr:GNAT family N-acetyltransferase [Caulobacter sp.]